MGTENRTAEPIQPRGLQSPRLLDRLAIRAHHYNPRTEEAYRAWIKRYIVFHDKRHHAGHRPAEIDCKRLQPIPARSSAAPATARPLSAHGYRQSP
ncbi:MAG: hypothetical protein EHM71_10915 [Zetaproteobacteria bacterium]|nr:MAG: hypothetical protein EHM71_10915 [Zetaproteobacteria bacterium]